MSWQSEVVDENTITCFQTMFRKVSWFLIEKQGKIGTILDILSKIDLFSPQLLFTLLSLKTWVSWIDLRQIITSGLTWGGLETVKVLFIYQKRPKIKKTCFFSRSISTSSTHSSKMWSSIWGWWKKGQSEHWKRYM